MNRRKHPRCPVAELPANVLISGRPAPCRVEDISRGGLFLRTPERLPVGMAVVVDLARPGARALRVTGRVVRTAQGKMGFGIRFDGLDADSQERLTSLLRSLGGDAGAEGLEVPEAGGANEPFVVESAAESLNPLPKPAAVTEYAEPETLPWEAPSGSAEKKPQAAGKAEAGGSDQAKLSIQIRGLVMELGARDDALVAKDRIIERLEAEVSTLRAQLAELQAQQGTEARAIEVEALHAELRGEAAQALDHLRRILDLAKPT